MSAPLRYGLIGCGNIAGRHATAIRETPAAALVAVSDLDPARASALAAEHGVEVAPTMAALLGRDDVDAVVVTAPATVHAELAMAAIESGKHALVEKPIDVRLDDAERVVAEAAKRGLRLSVVSQNRFHDDMLWARDVIAGGALGRPVMASVFSLWRRDQKYYDSAPGRGRHDALEGGVLLNQAVHAADLMLWLMGPAKSALAHRSLRTHEIAAEDTCVVAVDFESGAVGTLQTTTSIFDAEPERLELRFERGTIVIQGGKVLRHAFAEGVDAPPPPSASGAPDPDRLEPFRRQHADFCAAVREGRDPLVTPAEALGVLRLITQAYQAPTHGLA